MKVSNGVRNLIPGSGAPAGESAPPSPPPAPTGGGAEAAGSMVRSGAGTGRMVNRADTVGDLRHVIEASVEAGNTANDLRRTTDTAENLENLRSAARLTGSSPLEDLENIRVAVGQVGDTPYQRLEDLRPSVAQAVGDNGFESLYAGGSLYGTGYGRGDAVADDDLYATVGQHIGWHYGEDLSGRPALPGRYPGHRPLEVLNFVADGRNVVEVSPDTYRRLERGEAFPEGGRCVRAGAESGRLLGRSAQSHRESAGRPLPDDRPEPAPDGPHGRAARRDLQPAG